MRTLMNRSWTRAACCAALAGLVCVSQLSWGQNDAPRPKPPSGGQSLPEGSESVSELVGTQADDAFEQYASLNRLVAAWREMDPALMTDAALQFADGERILLRSHKSIKASQVFDLADRLATENRDKESLSRIAKALERSGDKERLQLVNLALKTAGAARAVDPILNEGNAEARLAIQAVQGEIQSARVAGSKPQLKALEKSLVDLPISDKQRAAVKRAVAEAGDSLGEDKGVETIVVQLDRLSGVSRPIGEVKEPDGGKFRMPDFKDEMPIEEQIDLFAKCVELLKNSNGPPPIGMGLPTGGLAKLAQPSRAGGWTDQYPYNSSNYAYNAYGVGSIFQYANAATKYQSRNCGQAAVATMLTFHKCAYEYNDDKLQILLEQDKYAYNPDMPFGGGTSPSRVMTIANAFGLNTSLQGGYETGLRKWVGWGYPCICLMDVGKAGWGKNGLHYTVVYAYDGNNYWCTNWQGSSKVPRNVFTSSWVRIIGMDFLLTWPKPNSNHKY